MQIEQELAKFSSKEDRLLTIGVFDGVHLGHKHLISRLTELARKQGLASGVVTFRHHPREVLAPRTKLPFLTDLERRIELLRNEGVGAVIPLPFTPKLAALSPKQFLELLQRHLRMKGLVIGPDFALGKNREGNTDVLRKLSQEMGFSLTVASPLLIDGEAASSTAIREALAEGDMSRVEKLLGRSFRLQGQVVAGDKRGTELLGFPTANLDIKDEQALPAEGVYTSRVYLDDHTYPAMTNIGYHPTFGGDQRLVEVYLLGYRGDLYGRELAVDIISRLRGEIKFDDPEKLKKQIAKDVKQGQEILKSQGGS